MNRIDPARATNRGFGLTELMVALAVMGVVLVAVFSVFFKSQGAAQRTTTLVDERQNARAAIQLLERDLRMSGSGWGRQSLYASINGVAANPPFRGLNTGYGGGANNDSLYIIGGWTTVSPLSAAMTFCTSTLKVTNALGFADGNLLVVTNGTNAELLQCTGVDLATGTLSHGTATSIFNTSSGFTSWPVGGFPIGALVYKATWVSYRFDTLNFKKPCLVRQEFGSPPAVAAWGVNGFQVFYMTQDSVLVRSPSSINVIDEVQPVLHFADVTPTKGTRQDSVWSSVMPRTF